MPTPNLFINTLQTDPQYFFAVCITVVVSICLHELAHGIVAVWLGDRTPIETGHMTLNPVVHMGVISLVLLLSTGIAWGAMPVNRNRLRGRYAGALVAIAGPVANIVLAALALTTVGVTMRTAGTEGLSDLKFKLLDFLLIFGTVNLSLAMLNLFPVPPLDGSNVIAGLSPEAAQLMQKLRNTRFPIAILIVFFLAGSYLAPTSIKIATTYISWLRGD